MPMSCPVRAAGLLISVCISARAAEPVSVAVAADPTPAAPVAKVEVKAKVDDYDPRRDDTAAKSVITQQEILRYGDTNIYDVLKRAPGVTVTGSTIRMRGLGSGYTQILVDGARPPPGFSMDALAPDQIERIEIIRAASAEYSTQAIAGTVNIVLKKASSKFQRDLRLSSSRSTERRNAFVNATRADRSGDVSWVLNGAFQHNSQDVPGSQTDRFQTPDSTVVQLRDSESKSAGDNSTASIQPRLNWKVAADEQLNVSANIQAQRGNNLYQSRNDNLIGTFPAPDFIQGHSRNDFSGVFGSMEINWITKLWGGKLDAKLNASDGHFDSVIDVISATVDDALQLRRFRDGHTRFPSVGSSGKYTRSVLDGHALTMGWQYSHDETKDTVKRIEGYIGEMPDHINEYFNPVLSRRAAFIQDEWNLTANWSAYLGVRDEEIRTTSKGTGLSQFASSSRVLSPIAHTLYKFPDQSGRQFRLALTRTFKAPQTSQLSARRWDADVNTRFTPDSSGNPALKPELANGVDLTYEHFWTRGAVFSLGTSIRKLSNYIRSTLSQDAQGRWLVQPVNDGNAVVRTLDMDAKFPLKAVLSGTHIPNVDLRFNVNRNWSKVDSVPGPDNRIDDQIPWSATIGADYKADRMTMGFNFALRGGGGVRISEEQSRRLQARRDLDAYVQYTIRKGFDVKISVANALGVDTRKYSRYQNADGVSESWSRTPSSLAVRLNAGIQF
nr:TonB-dependent receptor [Duganella sp. 1411]